VRDELEQQLHALGFDQPLHALGFDQPQKMYAVYYDGRSSFARGGGPWPWPPALPGDVAALYLHGLYNGPVPCDTNPWGTVGNPGHLEFSMIHEIMHALGFVPTCAPRQTLAGHVSDSPNDVMYAGGARWAPSTLDVGHDDYCDDHLSGCLDLSASASLTGGRPATSTAATTATTATQTQPATTATTGATTTPRPPARCTVPEVEGRTLAAAKRKLRAGHCAAGAITRVHSSAVRAGRVISQKPAPAGACRPAPGSTSSSAAAGSGSAAQRGLRQPARLRPRRARSDWSPRRQSGAAITSVKNAARKSSISPLRDLPDDGAGAASFVFDPPGVVCAAAAAPYDWRG
jgi:hypothetical protein